MHVKKENQPVTGRIDFDIVCWSCGLWLAGTAPGDDHKHERDTICPHCKGPVDKPDEKH